MPRRLGRLQRQSRRAFGASTEPEVSTSELASWCWARQTLMEKRAPSRWQRESMIRAVRSIGAVRTRRIERRRWHPEGRRRRFQLAHDTGMRSRRSRCL
jgi:hypothetical protein